MTKWLKLFWLFLRVAFMDWRKHRAQLKAERRRQHWQAVSPHGRVDLGYIPHFEALKRAGALGTVSYVDKDAATIFYDTHTGGPPPSGMRP